MKLSNILRKREPWSCIAVPFLLAIMSWPTQISSQTLAADIDLSGDLERLEALGASPNSGDISDNTIADTDLLTSGSWQNLLDDLRQGNADLTEKQRQEDERTKREEERRHQEKIDKAKSDCRYYWETPRQCDKKANLPKLLSHNEVTCAGPTIDGLDYCKGTMRICLSSEETQENPNKYYSCMRGYAAHYKTKNNFTMTVGVTGGVEARRKKDTERIQSNCREKRAYCEAIKSEIAAGKAPTKALPKLKRAEQEKLAGVSGALNTVLQDVLYELSDEFRDKQRRDADAKDQAQKAEIEQKRKQRQDASRMSRAQNELFCTEAISNGIYYCSCSEHFDKDVPSCTK